MPKITVDFGTGFYQSDSLPYSNQRCVNLYPITTDQSALNPTALFSVAGTRLALIHNNKESGKSRGAWVFKEQLYVIFGQELCLVTRALDYLSRETFTSTVKGVIPGNGTCSISDNGSQMIIINDLGDGFIYEDDTLTPITDAGFSANGTPKRVVFVDSYFIVTTDQNYIIVSAVRNGLDWNALDRFTAEADPDKVVAPFVFRNQLYILGSQTTETYRAIGGTGTPFARINGFVLAAGASAPETVSEMSDGVFWVGNGKTEKSVIWFFNGSQLQKISTRAIDTKLAALSNEQIENMFSWTYSSRGSKFIAFTSDEFTYVFDISTGAWHERESTYNDSYGRQVQTPSRIKQVISAYNRLIATDVIDGRIGVIDSEYYKEYENILPCYFTTMPLFAKGEKFSLGTIQLLCETGVGNKDVSDPQVSLSISRDGRLFDYGRSRSLGRVGEYRREVKWLRNRSADQFTVFKIEALSPCRRRFYTLFVNAQQGKPSGR